jgi:hypothetical protein
MANAKNWAVTDFSQDSAMVLNIDGVGNFDVVQFTASFAKNEVPRATCLVAIGRDVRSPGAATVATIHKVGLQLTQMKKATVTFTPAGSWKPGCIATWAGSKVIFDGYYVGMSYRKILDKVQPVVHLIHWLADLGFSSTLSHNLHPSVPATLGSVAAMGMAQGSPGTGLGPGGTATASAGGTGELNTMGGLEFWNTIDPSIRTDVWQGIKTMLCTLANDGRPDFLESAGCYDGSLTDYNSNDRAKRALARIEGPTGQDGNGDCAMAYTYAKALPIQINDDEVIIDAVVNDIGSTSIENYEAMTFWDTLVLQIMPEYGLALVPMIDRALVIADVPALRTPWQKPLNPDDYEGFEWTGMLTQPLWGIFVTAGYSSMAGARINQDSSNKAIVGGFSVDANSSNDGMFMAMDAPRWLQSINEVGEYAGASTGVGKTLPSLTTTTDTLPPKPDDPLPDAAYPDACAILTRWAQTMYIDNMLRGRSATISGKLRFDIGVGSIVQVQGKPEQFSDGTDELAVTMHGQVNRVTVNINSESSLAGTSFTLSHVRTATENTQDRTSIAVHPLFGADVYNGAPLIGDNAWLFAGDGSSLTNDTAAGGGGDNAAATAAIAVI